MSLRSSSGRRPTSACSAASALDWESGDGVCVPFAGGEHDWAALELGAWLASSRGTALRLLGIRADARDGRRDASRLLADASISVQRAIGVDALPQLVDPDPAALVEAAQDCNDRRDRTAGELASGTGLREARRALVRRSRPDAARAQRPSTERTRSTRQPHPLHLDDRERARLATGMSRRRRRSPPSPGEGCALYWGAILCTAPPHEMVPRSLATANIRFGPTTHWCTVFPSGETPCGIRLHRLAVGLASSRSIVEHGPIPAAVRCCLFQVVMMSARSGSSRK